MEQRLTVTAEISPVMKTMSSLLSYEIVLFQLDATNRPATPWPHPSSKMQTADAIESFTDIAYEMKQVLR